MAIKPMLFNTEMVRAILSGQKTCTRRVVKPVGQQTHFWEPLHDRFIIEKVNDGWQIWLDQSGNPYTVAIPPCQPDDILYVRETWGDYSECTPGGAGYCMYRADYPDGAKTTVHPDGTVFDLPRWRPSIHMPKEAARIFLRVTGVRVERLQHITRDGAIAEGCNAAIPLLEFQGVWDSTIKHTDLYRCGWVANPWVWVIEFERISKEAALGGDGE